MRLILLLYRTTKNTTMANTYSQLYIQFVFSVKGRQSFILASFREELEKIICSIVMNQKCKPIAIYCNPDHTHLFVSLHPNISSSSLMEKVKSGSTLWINQHKKIVGKFSWQDGYGAFSYSKSQKEIVKKYIENQFEHHRKTTFRDEYHSLLEKFEIAFDPKYVFEYYD